MEQKTWYDEIPEGSFISKNPTYKVGQYFSRFHTGSFTYEGLTIKYYWHDPREYGYEDSGKMLLLMFHHGTSNALEGDICINYTGAELYASDSYQKSMGGAYILIPVANEYRDESGKVQGGWSADYLEIVHALSLDFIKNVTNGVGKRIILGNSSGATFVLRLMDKYMDDYDVCIPVGGTALAEDSVLDEYDTKGKFLFLAIGKRDELHPFEEEIVPRLPKLKQMKNCFLFTPEWVRNGDKGIASINFGFEMGQHCLMNGIQANLMFDDGTPMDERLPHGLTGWIADFNKR